MEKAKEETGKEGQKEKIKLEWDGEMIGVLLDKLNEDKEDYYMTLTNYTCLIQTEFTDFHFLKHLQRPIVFTVNGELKRYMDTNLGKTINYIDSSTMQYYSTRETFKPFYKHKAYNIDINAAYPSCLLVNNLIDVKLYDRLMSLNKDERLAAIGMLAARQRIFTIKGGIVTEYDEVESEYSKYFFFCVSTISSIIKQCQEAAGDTFIYSWVDGLYVTTKAIAEKCRRLLSANNYNSTVAEITDFQYTPFDDKIRITFIKDKENKLFNIPIEKDVVSQILKHIHHEIVHNQDQ